MNVQKRNDVSIYCLSSGPTLPEWLGERARRNLSKKDESVRRRIELIQDFQMPASSSKIVQSADGRYIIVAGTYPPRIRCYDVHDLSMKFERYVDAGVIDMVMLSEDYGKIALLLDDRNIAFHAPYGNHEMIRIPTFGRAMAYECTTCELLLAAKGNQVYRVNLEEGRFSEPWTFEPSSCSATCITVNQSHPLVSIGCEDGIVRFWDSRTPDSLLRPFLKLDVKSATEGYGLVDENITKNPGEISSIAHDPSGLYMAAGTAGGLVALYDVRSSRPLHVKEHKHGLPIHTIKFHSGSGLVLSSDAKIIKAWRYKSSGGDSMRSSSLGKGDDNPNRDTSLGSVRVNLEATGNISHFITAGDENDPFGDRSGVLLCASDQPKMESYYIPAIGVAPKWCSFLENITEELEERDLDRDGPGAASDLVRDGQESVYDNYKFVSRDDVEKLGISNLIGTPLLRGYMHGFFIHMNLYNRVKSVTDPFEYDAYQKKKIKERLEAKRSSRISPRSSDAKSKATVNRELVERLEYRAADDTTKTGRTASKLLADERFGNLFTNPDFHIDEEAEDFRLRNPSGVAAAKRRKNNLDSDEEEDSVDFERASVDDEAHQHAGDVSSDEDESDDEDESAFTGKGRVRSYKAEKTSRNHRKKHKKNTAVALEPEDGIDMGLGMQSSLDRTQRRAKEMNMPLAKRIAEQKEEESTLQVKMEGGSKEVSFVPRDKKRSSETKESSRERGSRRGVRELGLRNPFGHRKRK